MQAILAERDALCAALARLVTDEQDDPCWYDHHGYCQAHFLEEDCSMAHARKILREAGAQ